MEDASRTFIDKKIAILGGQTTEAIRIGAGKKNWWNTKSIAPGAWRKSRIRKGFEFLGFGTEIFWNKYF